jgi:hypothetical protein
MSRLRFNPSQVIFLQNALSQSTPLPPTDQSLNITPLFTVPENTICTEKNVFFFSIPCTYMITWYILIINMNFVILSFFPFTIFNKWMIINTPFMVFFYILWLFLYHDTITVMIITLQIFTQIVITALADQVSHLLSFPHLLYTKIIPSPTLMLPLISLCNHHVICAPHAENANIHSSIHTQHWNSQCHLSCAAIYSL